MSEPIEIFAHGVHVTQCDDAESVLVIGGKGWEGEPFTLYLNEEEVSSLLVQLSYYVTGDIK